MSCDISRIFHTLVRALETTGECRLRGASPGQRKSNQSFSFSNRAASLQKNLRLLADYIRRVQKLTGDCVGNKFKQKTQADLTEQVTTLIEHCGALLVQLDEISGLDDQSGAPLTQDRMQTRQHRQAIFESLEEELNRLRSLRDLELERQRHLLELTGSLAAGVRSVPSARLTTPSTAHGSEHTEDSSLRKDHQVQNYSDQHGVTESERHATDDLHLTETERQVFETENHTMYEHLSEQRDELSLVARAISEIGKLNQALSTHLTEQLETTQQMGTVFATSTENVRQGNEMLRSALSTKASVQFWILFTMIVLTFSLHFLDWYYP
ncbi:hypothetical protein EG68_11583 [Paragonimus skrjabini miyazakii]|uniref:t-SNARE coiled-coil homology domain-containing protein n=1 Tax=Paragonimus skrjabini miyazakii TaxID=59628 RepID=A0A8S9YI36_9TREM|nr:hypothetical protein EG68_11583 [Paragonimus skrjabini miyazakii]